jgi:hypothetical protein
MLNPAINPPDVLNGFTEQLRDRCGTGLAEVKLRNGLTVLVEFRPGIGFNSPGNQWWLSGMHVTDRNLDMAEI